MELKTATTAPNSVTAAVIKGMLESAGIPVMLRISNIGAGLEFPATLGGPGPVDVLVPAELLGEAQELIAEAEAGGREG